LVLAIKNNLVDDCKYIIVPHDIDKDYCINLKQKIKVPTLLYSEISSQKIEEYKVLVIDSVGLLSNLYQYVDLALIGGGFNKGIHNILSINSYDDYSTAVKHLLNDEKKYRHIKKQLQNYVDGNVGATKKIYDDILHLLH